MRAKAGILILLGLFLIVGTVSAYVADSDSSIIASGSSWPVANGSDTSVITVTALNKTGGAVPLATVSFSLTGYENYGTLSGVTATTDSAGKATTTFKTKTKSGTAVITATITSSDAMGSLSVPLTLNQEIDHDKAVNTAFNNPSELPAGSNLTLVVTVTDSHGNLVDNRNPAEPHTFNLYMTSAEGRGFWDGSGYSLITTAPPLQTDTFGNASVDLRIASAAGTNMIFMDKIGSISHNPQTSIKGVAIQDPAYMIQKDPVPPEVYANGVDYFQLSYFVYDPQMNLINGTVVHIVTSDGEVLDKESVDGLIYLEYGQKSEAQTNTITVTSTNATMMCQPDGTIGSCTQDLLFVTDKPVDLLLIGSPTTLSSFDQATGTKEGTVRAIVVDPLGNPVEDQAVTFALTIETDPPYRTTDIPKGPYVETQAPALTTVRSATNYNNITKSGSALAFFTPGAFTTDTSNPDYSGSATGNATVTATWTNKDGTITKTKSVRFIWKNYPTLSVKVPADLCKDVHVGDTINMTVSIFGDGAALAPNPIDAMLVMDKSSSMRTGNLNDGVQRIVAASKAGSTFVGQMDSTRDKVGLTSYCKVESVDYALSDQFTDVIAKINNLPSQTCDYTGTRKALKTAIEQFPPYDPASKSIRAIILLTDGEFNWYGDPLARWNATSKYDFGATTYTDRYTFFSGLPAPSGSSTATFGADTFTNQNMSEYATLNHIRVYTITISKDLTSGMDTYKAMTILAESTGGKHFHANSQAELTDYYTQIAGELQEKAGGNAEIYLDFAGAKNGNTGGSIDIKEYMNYTYSLPDSTHVTMVNKTHTIQDYTTDDTDNWDRGSFAPLLYFKAGEMNLNDLWTLNFKVKLYKSGNVQLFGTGDNSSVCFLDVKTNKKTCSIIEPINCPIKEDVGGGFNDEKVTVDITEANSLGADPTKLTVKWSTTYVGDGSVGQTLSYKNVDITNPVQHYATAYTISDGAIDPPSPVSHQTTLDTSSWPPGRYSIKVVGSSGKASGSDEAFWVKQDTNAQVYLKLE
jgi:hypothetical protein